MCSDKEVEDFVNNLGKRRKYMDIKRILVVLPHPDDEVFPMSGTLAKYVEEGSFVTYACLTLGEMGRNLGNPPFANRITLPKVRQKELEKSCGIIGIQDLRLLGYHDKTIEFEPYGPLDAKILEIILEVKPEIIFTFYPGYGVHPDHNACGAAVIRTVESMNELERPIVMCSAFPTDNDLGKPQVVNDIKPYIEKKIECLRAHSSQFQIPELKSKNPQESKKLMERIGNERFWIYKF